MSSFPKHTRGANIQIANTTINCSRPQQLLGRVFDKKLSLTNILRIFFKNKQDIKCTRMTDNYVELSKRRILMNAFF